jgi:hypothetical protein
MAQTGEFYPNTIGFPIRIELEDLTVSELGEITSMTLTVTRPDRSSFSRTLGPGDIVNDEVQYVTQSGDLPVGGRYHYSLVLSMTGSRTLPLLGSFEVQDVDVRTDDTHAVRMLALIEAALEGRIPQGLELTIINGQNITRIPVSQLSVLRDKYLFEVQAEREAARIAAGLPSRRTTYARFTRVGGIW